VKDKTIVWSGELPIKRPGIYAEVPLDIYHGQKICPGPSVSSTGLRRVLEENGGSPKHFYAEWSGNPKQIELAEKKHWTFGRAVHHLMLGQPDFAREFVFRPTEIPDQNGILVAWQSNKTICREWMAQAAFGGARWDDARHRWIDDPKQAPLTVLLGEDALNIVGIADALKLVPEIFDQERPGIGLLSGQIERSLFWQDSVTGIWLKARPDAVPTDSPDYVDLKTTESVQYIELMRTISKCAYHQQAALIGDGTAICVGMKMSSFALVFVEKRAPYCVRIVMLRSEDVALGARQNRRALAIIAHCMESGYWPGPGEGHITHIDLLPNYAESAKLNNETYEKETRAA